MIKIDPHTEVIKAYVENSTLTCQLSPTDLIALKQKNIPDDITTALLKQGAEVKAQTTKASVSNAVATVAVRNLSTGVLDPESYEYFQHYYLYPRTLSSVYQRLPPYPAPYYYGYRYPSASYPYHYGFRGRFGRRAPIAVAKSKTPLGLKGTHVASHGRSDGSFILRKRDPLGLKFDE